MDDPTPLPGAAADRGKRPDAAARLRQLWLQGQRPDAGEFLAGCGSLPPAEVVAVLRADQCHRWQSGEHILAETYLRQHPDVAGHAESALDLIYSEWLLREQDGEDVNLDDFLARFPGHGPVLRMQVQLHRAIAQCRETEAVESPPTQEFIPDPAGDTPPPEPSPPPAVRSGVPVLAGYDILEEVGRGGMGVVYKAWHLPLRRVVALKMLLAGPDAGPDQLARLRAEAEAVARLQHPNIVQIFDVGEVDGRPFLALEYVDGGSLGDRLSGLPQPARPAAALLETLARAMHHAHQHGIVHRDLKPANILLSFSRETPASSCGEALAGVSRLNEVVPKITDFGLAKRLAGESGPSPPGQTHSGDILGTPSYMAPEQAVGRRRSLGPAADVYSLGAILYQLVTGRPPFQGETPLDTLQQVLTEEPIPPARLQPGLPPDLGTICLKCLQKEPARRYASAWDLAEDLRRFRAGEPIRARPVGPFARLGRWGRRNPAVASLGATLGLILLGSVVGLTALYLNAESQRRRAVGAEENWRTAAAEARTGEKEARQAEADTKAVLGFFQKRVLAAGRPKGQEGGLGHDATIRAAVDQAEPDIARAFAEQPLVEASVREALGFTYWFLGEYPRSIAQQERSLALRRAQLPADHPDTLNAMASLAQAYQGAGRVDEALRLHEETLALRKVRLGPTHPETLWTMNRLAGALNTAGRLAEALPLYEEAFRLAQTSLGPDHLDTLIYMDNLGVGYRTAGRLAEALPLFLEALRREQVTLEPNHPDTLATMNNLAVAYHEAGRLAEAVQLQQETLALRKARLGPEHSETLNSMNNLGAAYRDAGRLAEAVPLLEQAFALEKAQDGPDHPFTLTFMGNLATAYREAGRLAEARALYEETLQLQKAKLGPDHPRRLLVMNDLGACLLRMKRFDEAAELLRDCLALRARKDPGDWWVFQTRSQLGQALIGLKHYAAAEALLEEAHRELAARKDKVPGRYHRFVGEAALALANLYETQGKKEQAALWRQKLSGASPPNP